MYEYEGTLPSYRLGGYDINLYGYEQVARLLFDRGIPDQYRTALLNITDDYGFDMPLFTEFILETGLDMSNYMQPYDESGHYQFQLEKIIPLLKKSDIENMIEGFIELKRMYVEWLIDIFTDASSDEDAKEITRLYRPEINDRLKRI
jgi:hypothetical protein